MFNRVLAKNMIIFLNLFMFNTTTSYCRTSFRDHVIINFSLIYKYILNLDLVGCEFFSKAYFSVS